ncbi:MAG: peptidase S26B, signal peptidase [Cenarchaeum symbiont of Oopsacas minuta]|nr:peptidase S26B, signal peptidase [Cenarchaeum symbiont of Oopsacas minuta]
MAVKFRRNGRMVANILSNKVIRDLFVTLAGLVVVWVLLQATLGVANPFYVVSSGSMVPELEVNDIIVVQGKNSIDEVQIGDIIVFDRPSDHDRVIVHRVESITNEDPVELRTKGDANSASIPGTDYPITAEEYIGTVIFTVPQVGYVTKVLTPPTNYIIMAIIIAIMIAKHFLGKKSKNKDIDPAAKYFGNSKDDTKSNIENNLDSASLKDEIKSKESTPKKENSESEKNT